MATAGAFAAAGEDRIAKAAAASPQLQPLGLYEKSVLFRAQREAKLRALRTKLMKDCTFIPRTNASSSSPASASLSKSTAQTSPSSVTTVWERLYNHNASSSRSAAGSNRSPGGATTPVHSNLPPRRGSLEDGAPGMSAIAPPPVQSRKASTAPSARLEQLYEEGVRKLRRRAATDRIEAERRRRNWEDRQLQEERGSATRAAVALDARSRAAAATVPRASHLVMRPVVMPSSDAEHWPVRRAPTTMATMKQPLVCADDHGSAAGPFREPSERRLGVRHNRRHHGRDPPSPPADIPSEIWIQHPRRRLPPDTAPFGGRAEMHGLARSTPRATIGPPRSHVAGPESGSSGGSSSGSPARTNDSVIWEQSTEYASI